MAWRRKKVAQYQLWYGIDQSSLQMQSSLVIGKGNATLNVRVPEDIISSCYRKVQYDLGAAHTNKCTLRNTDYIKEE